MRYADTSALIPLYFAETRSAVVAAAVASHAAPLVFTWLHEVEFQNALRLKCFRTEATNEEVAATMEAIRADAVAGVLRQTRLTWDEVFREALAISAAHSSSLGTRSLDVLHVAAARVCGADEFLTCDERQSRLAEVIGIPVAFIR